MWILTISLAALVLTQTGTAQAEVIQQGPWSLNTMQLHLSYNGPSYTDNTSTVSACVQAPNMYAGTQWNFAIIWYDGGADKIVWASLKYSQTGTNCSPKETLSGVTKPKFLVRVTVYGDGLRSAGGNGLWALHLDLS